MAEQVANPAQLLIPNEPLERCAVSLLDCPRELPHELLVRGDAHDRIGEHARVGRPPHALRRPAEGEAEEQTLLDADPLADHAAVGAQLAPLEHSLERLPVPRADGFVGRRK